MEIVGNADALAYGEYRGQKQLRVNVRKVSQSLISEVTENYPVSAEGMTVNGEVTAYAAGEPPHRRGQQTTKDYRGAI